jgi:hypothetical protein
VTAATLSNATFTDANTGAPASDFTVTAVTWGDGSTDTTGLTISGSGGSYSVNGSHRYADEGTYNFSITVTDDGGNTATITGSTTVGDANLKGSFAATATGGVEGVTAATLSSATFTDANTGAPASDFTVTAVSWGDGKTSTTGLTISGSGGYYTVSGSHLYAEEGTYNFKMIVTDDGGQEAEIYGSTTVGDASLTGSSAAAATGGVEGVTAATLSNATFTDANTGAPPSDFTVTAVTWGDGNTSTAGLSVSGSNGNYTVNGSHLYAEDGTYHFSIAVKDNGGSSTTITGTATVADAALAATGAPAFQAPEGLPFSNQLVATFTDATPLGGTGDFTATIHWGDGNTSTGTVLLVGHGASSSSYQVLGGHTYAVGRAYPITVSIVDVGGATANTNLTPTIATVPSNILLLNPTQAGALTVTGQGQVKVGGTVQVDSSSSRALQESGKANISAGNINIVGGDQISGQATTSVTPVLGAPSVADPLMALTAPDPGTYPLTSMGAVNLAGKNTQTISPGIYTSITVTGQATLNLLPGIYVLAGGGLTVSGQATVNGPGVLIYNAGSNFVNGGAAGGTFGAINVSGQADLNITPMKGGPYAGIVLFQSGYNSQSGINSQALTLSGQSVLPDGGLVYAPAAPVNLGGNTVFSASVIASTLNVSGNAIVQTVVSVAQLDAALQAQVTALQSAGVLNKAEANSLFVDLNLQGNQGDIASVQAFLKEVQADVAAGILTQAEAAALLGLGNTLLLGLTVEFGG